MTEKARWKFVDRVRDLGLVSLGLTAALSSASVTQAASKREPKIFNAPVQAAGGDIIALQGANFDVSTTAYFGTPARRGAALPIVNRLTDTLLSLRLPPALPNPAQIFLQNSSGTSVVISLNAAVARHIDATQLVPGGRFRLFGLNLKQPGFTPTITVNGRPALIDLNGSSSIMLAATAPSDLTPRNSADILVDNGNGTGATRLGTPVSIRAGSGDPARLGVGWAAGFDFLSHIVQAHPVCDGATDDTWAIESMVVQAHKDGGGVVQLPAGTCRIAGTINLDTRVVLRGAGQSSTVLVYAGNYPIYAENFDLVGLQDLELRNAGPVQEGVIWRSNTRSFIRRVIFDMGVSRQWFFTSNSDFVFEFNTILQSGSYNDQNPYRFDSSRGMVFRNNRSVNVNGSPTFQFVHDVAFLNNEFTRDASTQNESHIVVHHSFVADFSYRLSLVGNTFDVDNGPVTNRDRNDGETFLIEGGGGFRTENIGTVQSAASTTLTDTNNTLNVDPFGTGLPENYAVAIVSGAGTGQTRRVIGYSGKTLQIDRPWDIVPTAGSHYSTFVWGLKEAILSNNVLSGNPRGIWLYQSSVKDIDLLGNRISSGGGIFLRSYQKVAQKMFTVQYDINIEENTVSNTNQLWMSYIAIDSVSSDVDLFGTGQIGIGIRHNTLVANKPNLTSTKEDYASQEGYTALMRIEPAGGRIGTIPAQLGVVFQGNSCQNCQKPIEIGTGTFGSVLSHNSPSVKSPNSLFDLVLLGSKYGASTGTFLE